LLITKKRRRMDVYGATEDAVIGIKMGYVTYLPLAIFRPKRPVAFQAQLLYLPQKNCPS
jgi:hypothetical protein